MSNDSTNDGGPTRHCEFYGEPQHEDAHLTESDLFGEDVSRCDERDLYTRQPHFSPPDAPVSVSPPEGREVRVV